jgi:hypothetical protein
MAYHIYTQCSTELEKQEEKQKRDEEKAAQKHEKEAEKARKAEEKRVQKEEKRKSKEARKSYISNENTIATEDTDENGVSRTRAEYSVGVSVGSPVFSDATSPTSPNRFSRLINKFKRSSKAGPSDGEGEGGAGLHSASSTSLSSSDDDNDETRGRPSSRGGASSAVSARREDEDRFDPSLMPAPAFASEKNTSSPARAAKFHEDL